MIYLFLAFVILCDCTSPLGRSEVSVMIVNRTPFHLELLAESEFNIVSPPGRIAAGEKGFWTCATELNVTTTSGSFVNDACGVEFQIGSSLLCNTLKLSSGAGMKYCDVAPFACKNQATTNDQGQFRSGDLDRRRRRYDDIKTCQPFIDCRWDESFGVLFTARCSRSAQQKQEVY
jgi:hypothetical protein